ncbi:tuberin-like isoform X2 [Littorina saxatilis]|uniref:tuberin-like isoform X2 n=1 Tax=Littorina saxatilis TaxID=31220 RepID=UPI0038B41F88
MSGRQPPKQEENLKNKFIGFFRRNKPSVQTVPIKPAGKDFIITPQILKDIGPECPFNNRMRNVKDLTEVVRQKKLEENAPEALWVAICDLVQPQIDVDSRHQALNFLLALIEGQLEFLGMLRGYFFHVIESLENPEDLLIRLDLFKALSEDGKNLLEFEEETGPFLLKLMPDALTAGLITDFLELLINVIKFNAAYIDEDIISGLVQQTCMIQNRTRSDEDMKLCLQVMDAVICYSFLPSDSLQYMVAALCHIINNPRFCDNSWELMKKLLGTHLGHKTIYTLCCMMQDKQHAPDFLMLRGAVFTMGMALWGSRRIATLKHSPSSVLPSFSQLLWYKNPLIAYEVVLTIHRLVHKFGKDLIHMAWDTILDILLELLHQSETVPEFDPRVSVTVHDTLTEIETLYQRGHFLGPHERIFSIIEKCSSQRPTESVCRLIDHHLREIHPGRDKWIQNLHQLLDKFYKQDTRTEVRKKALDKLSFVLGLNKHVYEVDMIDKLLIPLFCHIESDPDVEVRKMVVEIVIGMAQGCSRDEFFDLINIIEKILRKPLHVQARRQLSTEEEVAPHSGEDQSLEDVKIAFFKIIEAFKHKLYTAPPSHAQRLYALIISHMQAQYAQVYNTSNAAIMRKAGVELLLQLRADTKHRVGLLNRSGVIGCNYSAFVLCTKSEVDLLVPVSPMANLSASNMFTAIDFTPALEIFLQCLSKEVDWLVLKTLLTGLPSALENKTLVLSAQGNLVYTICGQLCAMVSQRNENLVRYLHRVPDGFKISDFDNCVLPVISAMVAFHPFMDRMRQLDMMKCFEFGLVTGVAKVCVTSLRICSLEMQDQMVRVLPKILISLSKISATVAMAIPVLAFLSSVVRLPKLYANFNNEQYMCVFAIALPYTNPFKFSHYTVSLAHHVVNIWFIRCRLPFRKGFVKYIVRHLSSYVQRLLQECRQEKLAEQQRLDQLNQDSGLRSRSGSEGTTSRRRRMLSGPPALRREHPLPMDEKMTQFHRELMETAIDSFSRYTFGNISNVYKRSGMAEFLLNLGPSETWLVGNKLITITTSGGGSKDSGSMFCSKCLELLQQSQTKTHKLSPHQEKRRRHKSAIFTRSISEVVTEGVVIGSASSPQGEELRHTRDDLSLVYESARDDAAVQTGSSLSSGFDIESLGSMMMNWKTQIEEKNVWATKPCPCWCSGWAEVLIRGPSGDVAWIMRTENLQCQTGSHGDPSVPDITLLFSPAAAKSPDTDTGSKLDSGSLKEEDYDTIHADIFGWDSKSEKSQQSPPEDQEKRSAEAASEMEVSTTSSLRKTNSTPSLLSSSTDDTSPADTSSAKLKEPLFAQDSRDSTSVQIRVDSSDSHAMVAAQNFEGLEKLKSTAEEEREIEESGEQKNLPSERKTTGDMGDGVRQTTNSSTQMNVPAESCSKEQGRISSKLQAQLKEYDRKRKEGEGEKDRETQQSPSPSPAKAPASPFKAGGEGGAVRFRARSGSSSGSLHQGPVTSPDSSSSSSITQDDLMELRMKKQRGHTISVMTPAEANRQTEEAGLRGGAGGKDAVGMVTPAEVFLQLYHTHPLIMDSHDLPLHVPNNEAFHRSLKLLDLVCPYETHNIGIIYVGPGQAKDEKGILSNRYGSSRYIEFIQGLGHMVRLPEPDQEVSSYVGALTSADGKFTYTWHDESMMVIFHIATLMPNRKGDNNYTFKKLHIGNDYVTIVYNDSGEDFKLGTLTGQFNYVNIVIRPLDHGSNAVTLLAKQDIADILGHTHPKIISDTNLALLVRQIAVHCNLASLVLNRQSHEQEPFASNCLERLRKIKRIRGKVTDHLNKDGATTGKNYGTGSETATGSHSSSDKMFVIEDFTDYV